jgi:hypothetical protein
LLSLVLRISRYEQQTGFVPSTVQLYCVQRQVENEEKFVDDEEWKSE